MMPKILIVDDDSVTLNIIATALEGIAETFVAMNGEECFAIVRDDKPDLILLDMVMPGMSGLSVLEAMKAEEGLSDIPVIVVTVKNWATEIRVLQAGAADFVYKPINKEVMLARVKTQLKLIERTKIMNQLIAELETHSSKMEDLAKHDKLTGYFNRVFLDDLLNIQMAAAQRGHTNVALMMIDIDHFKNINDSLGHQAGDEVIVNVTRIIKDRLRTSDMAFRYGGEEFLFILPDTSINGAKLLAEYIRGFIAQESIGRLPKGKLTVSVGIAGITKNDKDILNIINRADKALYSSKTLGRNRVEVYED